MLKQVGSGRGTRYTLQGRDTYLKHLSSDLPLPWLNVIIYDTIEEAIRSMQSVLGKYTKRSNYPRYLYVAAMGGQLAVDLEARLRQMQIVDLFKKEEEAYQQFLFYRPHQGSFFINDLVTD